MRSAQKAIVEFRAAVELYWWHSYAVRERVVEFLAASAGDKEHAGMLKSKKASARCAAKAALESKAPALMAVVDLLVGLLDAPIKRRNQHTHDIYVGIVYDTGDDSFDLDDVVLGDGTGAIVRRVRDAVAASVRRKARECGAHLQQVVDGLSELARVGEPTAEDWRGTTGITQAEFP